MRPQENPGVLSLGVPVFFDRTGRRWRRVLITWLTLAILATVYLAVVVPDALAPIQNQLGNTSSSLPKEITARLRQGALPELSEGGNAPLTQVAQVRRDGSQAYLIEPFSGQPIRPLEEWEYELVGDSEYVIDRTGAIPEKTLMLTFDDGPDPTYTAAILDVLSRNGVPATFFSIGENVVKHPELVARIIREGHMIGGHTFTHADFYEHDAVWDRQELIVTDHVIRAAGDYATSIWRVPRGDPAQKPLAVLYGQQLGYMQIDFTYDLLDWAYAPGQDMHATALPPLDGMGHVALLHDGGGDRSGTVVMLQRLIDEARNQGYSFSTLAPILPAARQPVKNIGPTLADRSVLGFFQGILVLPEHLLYFLFWFAVITMTSLYVLYLGLALVNYHRYQRYRYLSADPDRLISVVVPAWNEEGVIEKTLDSVFGSTHRNLDVIVVDDGSSDATLELLRAYERRQPGLRVLTQPNSGKAVALNAGFAAARSDIVVTMDGDTIFERQTIGVLARRMDEAGIGVVAGVVKVGNRDNLQSAWQEAVRLRRDHSLSTGAFAMVLARTIPGALLSNILTMWQSVDYVTGIGVTRMAEAQLGAVAIAPGCCSCWNRNAVLLAGGFSHDTLAEDCDMTLNFRRLGYRVVQEPRAIAWTEAPATIRQLSKQRLRWSYGNTQAFRKHWRMVLNPRYGWLGMLVLPYAMLSLLVPLVFMPLMVLSFFISVSNGNWESIALFALFVAGSHFIVACAAVAMLKESWWHLLFVPVYRLVYEPLRVYLLYAGMLRILMGRNYGWDKLRRTNSVHAPTAEPAVQTTVA
ncbi:glycosyltransferase [Candidatus Saccharibacteria bacterium]|nr:glycosyltransferase [Candidatus Saccharibacteria bacterium]